MSTTFHLRVWTRFLEPLDAVWARKTSAEGLATEFPLWLPFSIGDEAGLKRAFDRGEPCETQAKLGWLLPWPLRLESVAPGRSYKDSSVNALYTRFEHEHLFEETPEGCRYIDAVTFTPALPAAKLQAILTQRFFQRCHREIARHLRSDARATAVGVLRVLVEDLPQEEDAA
jgi:ligand-binding SRPBCC domain-containing protein